MKYRTQRPHIRVFLKMFKAGSQPLRFDSLLERPYCCPAFSFFLPSMNFCRIPWRRGRTFSRNDGNHGRISSSPQALPQPFRRHQLGGPMGWVTTIYIYMYIYIYIGTPPVVHLFGGMWGGGGGGMGYFRASLLESFSFFYILIL